MRANSTLAQMNNHVFINCPFDARYSQLFDALIFTIYFCEFKPRCALELEDGTQNRLDKIYNIIRECDLGIHDISRMEHTSNKLPHFNMPLELGIFMSAKQFGGKKQQSKRCLILDVDEYRYHEAISDIAGQDIQAHNNDPALIIKRIRNWLNPLNNESHLPGATAIVKKYNEFLSQKPNIFNALHLVEEDVQYADITLIIEEWIKQNPI